jgi:uncharacterized repeat protein (TIGR03843 family)
MTTQQKPIHTALQKGKIELHGQFMLGSNYTFLVNVHYRQKTVQAVYKPQRGEQPLWDFPESTLAMREVAAYRVSQFLGWGLVPYTILRHRAPYGAGSVQEFIDYDPNYHYFTFTPEDRAALRPTCLFDLLINNADRKGSHILRGHATKRLHLIDHGLCFHVEDKLRTVIWEFSGQPIAPSLLTDLARLYGALTDPAAELVTDLLTLLAPEEITALARRAQTLLETPIYPFPPANRRHFPYPLI